MPYIESLKQVKSIPFMLQPSREAGNDRRDRDGVNNDRGFLEDFVKLYAECPELLNARVPNIIKMAKNMPPPGVAIQLYTNETRTEFHHLLLELLDCFKKALDQLIALDKAADGSDRAVEKFNQNVNDAHLYGYALLRLSRGRAFRMHLENVESLLEDPRRSNAGASIEEHDEELVAIRSVLPPNGSDSAGEALVNSYIAWLRLMVGHFDAVEIIVRYVTSHLFPYDSISIEILLAPPTDKALLPWPELFTNHKFLRKSVMANYVSTVTNDEIHKFLNDSIARASEAKQVQNALKVWDLLEPDVQKTCQSLQPLVKSKDENVKEKVVVVLEKVTDWKRHGSEGVRDEITNEIKALCGIFGEPSDRDRFFLNLSQMSFTGTLHCEACLASLLPAFTQDIPIDDSKYKEIKILSGMQVEYPLSHLFLSSDPHFIFL